MITIARIEQNHSHAFKVAGTFADRKILVNARDACRLSRMLLRQRSRQDD